MKTFGPSITYRTSSSGRESETGSPTLLPQKEHASAEEVTNAYS
jgi:hypothetical protein